MTPVPCFFCGHVEGIGGRLPESFDPSDASDKRVMHAIYIAPDDSETDDEWWCLPLRDSWAKCGTCLHALPLHDLVSAGGPMSAPTFICRECVNPRRLVAGDYDRTTCFCDQCTSKAWRAVAPSPRQRRQDARSASRTATARDTLDPSVERQGRIAVMIASKPMTTDEIAKAMSTDTTTITQRTARRDVKAIGAVEVREGKSVRWTMPTGDTEDTGDTP